MALTVKDILEKTFTKKMRGFDEDEVDKFLDEIIDEMKVMQSEIASLKDEIEGERAHAKKVKDTEETIMHTLVSAQKSAERIISEASRKAEIIIANAEATSKRRAEQTSKELSEAQQRLAEVRKMAAAFSGDFNDMVQGTVESFKKTYSKYFGNPEGGISINALEKLDEDIIDSLKEMEEPGDAQDTEEFAEDLTQVNAEEQEKEAPAGEQEQETAKEEPKEEAEASQPKDNAEDSEDQKKAEPSDSHKMMEFTEINKALKEIEEGGEDILQDSYEEGGDDENRGAYGAGMDDYSWLYDDDAKGGEGVAFKDPKEKKELESLIDDIIE